jgi:hypothetical protein
MARSGKRNPASYIRKERKHGEGIPCAAIPWQLSEEFVIKRQKARLDAPKDRPEEYIGRKLEPQIVFGLGYHFRRYGNHAGYDG